MILISHFYFLLQHSKYSQVFETLNFFKSMNIFFCLIFLFPFFIFFFPKWVLEHIFHFKYSKIFLISIVKIIVLYNIKDNIYKFFKLTNTLKNKWKILFAYYEIYKILTTIHVSFVIYHMILGSFELAGPFLNGFKILK